MNEVLAKANNFIRTYARLLERRLFQVHFEGGSPECISFIIRAYQNKDGGLGHALEPDVRCSESQPIFASIGLSALEEVNFRDINLAESICNYLESVSDNNGLLPFFTETAYKSPIASHWINSTIVSGINPTAVICGLLHFQGINHKWLSLATNTCYEMFTKNPPNEAHALCCAASLAEYIPNKDWAMNLLDIISDFSVKTHDFIV